MARPGIGMLGWILVTLLTPVPTAGADPLGTNAVADPACAIDVLVQRIGAVAYRLPHPFLRPGSDSVWTRAAGWRRGADYALDYTRGELRLLREPVPGDTVWVRTCRLLTPPPLEFQLYAWHPVAGAGGPDSASAGGPASAPPPRPATSRSPTVAAAGTDLTLTGNKTIAVDFGSSQDVFLRQSLDLSVSGTLAPGVEL